MRRTAIGLLLASLSVGGGFAWAAPLDSTSARAQVRRTVPVAIDSEASLELFIGEAARLLQSDTTKQLAALTARLDALNKQKQGILQQIFDVERQTVGAEMAHDTKRVAALGYQLDALKGQLATVDVAIKNIVQQIQQLQDEEQRDQDDIKHAEENLQRLSEALNKAASQYTAIVGAASMNTFVRGLSVEKKHDTENKVRKALAQLAEARRIRLQLSTVSNPTFHPAPKPLKTK